MPLSKLPVRAMTPVRQKFCDNVRKLYVETYKQPCPTTDARIIKLALSYHYIRADDPEIHFLLSDIYNEEQLTRRVSHATATNT